MLFQALYKPTGTVNGHFEKLIFLYTNKGELRKVTCVDTHRFSNTELAYENKGYNRLFAFYLENREYNETKRVWKKLGNTGPVIYDEGS